MYSSHSCKAASGTCAKLTCKIGNLFVAFGNWLIEFSHCQNPAPKPALLASELNERDTVQTAPNGKNADVELLAVCQVLQVLERQLHDVKVDVESSVDGVCKGFKGMAQRAQLAVTTASESVSLGPTDSGSDVLSEMQTVLHLLIQVITDACDFSHTMSDQLANIESNLGDINKTLSNIEELSVRARVVALNGQVEAARLGEAGAAFSVVAQETKDLALNAANTSHTIRTSIGQLVNVITQTAQELRQRSKSDAERLQQSQHQALTLLKDIDNNHRDMKESLTNTAGISAELRTDIARAVMSMQFQDRVSQRVAHVIETLEQIVGRVDAPNDATIVAAASKLSSTILHEISERYTMDSERDSLDPNAPTKAKSEVDLDSFEVSLF